MKRVIILAGYGVRYPLGGSLLSQLYWLAGFQQLGYEPIWVEHYGWPQSCYDPATGTMTDDPSYGLAIMRSELARLGVARWCYVDAAGRYHGLTSDELRQACRESALLVSLASTTWVEEFGECRTRAFVDTDPGFTQFKMPATPSPSCAGYASPWDFTHHFTLGERVGRADCSFPTHGLHWRPTRWPFGGALVTPQFTPGAERFSTVMSWSAYGAVTYHGATYGQKDVEFLKVLDLPARTGKSFEVALAGKDAPAEKLRAAGWIVADALAATRTVDDYLAYIGRARGEFSVAKHGYVVTRSGWFSERTLTYLARGKPAIVQDTGFSEFLPTGEGLFAFRNADEVGAALEVINGNYEKHCSAARRVAEEYFDAGKILGAIVRACEMPGRA
jgi:hypothetical protein